MKDALEIKKALLQTLIGSLKDGEGETMKTRPVTAESLQKGMEDDTEEEDDAEEGSGEAEEVDLEDEDTLARLKKMFGA